MILRYRYTDHIGGFMDVWVSTPPGPQIYRTRIAHEPPSAGERRCMEEIAELALHKALVTGE